MSADDVKSTAYETEIVEAFFDLYNTYLEMQYVMELCKPYFEIPHGREIVNDLIRISLHYGSRIEEIISLNKDLLMSEIVVDRVSNSIVELADKLSKIPWPDHVQIYNNTIDDEFSEYITSALIDAAEISGFDGREWYYNRTISDRKEIICRTRETRERNGAYISFDDENVRQIVLFENDVPIFTIHVYNDGSHEVVRGKAPIEIPVEQEQPSEYKNDRSDVTWGAVIAGAVGGLMLSSLLKTRHAKRVSNQESSQEQGAVKQIYVK